MKKFLFQVLVLFLLLPTSNVFSAEGDTYDFAWLDPDKEVYVLQNRKYRKAGRLHAYLGGGKTLSGAFVDATTLQARVGYFFKEEWGFEGIYAKNSGSENVTAKSVRDNGNGVGSRPFRRITDGYVGGMFLWSPFYSKINTFNTIIYYDWIFGVGYGQLQETNNLNEFQQIGFTGDETLTHNGYIWDIGLMIYINQMMSLRIDVTAFHYKATSPDVNITEELWNDNFDLSFSFGLNF